MPTIVVCLPSGVEARIVADIERYGHRLAVCARQAGELESAVERGDVEWAVIGAGSEQLTSRMLSTCDAAGVRIVALAADDVGRRNAADLGLREVLDEGASWPEIEGLLGASFTAGANFSNGASSTGIADHTGVPNPIDGPRNSDKARNFDRAGISGATRQRERAGQREESGRGGVIAVWGPAGAPGRTTVAITIAAQLAAEGYSVALADADTHSAAVAPSLGLLDEAPGFAAACRLASTDSLTTAELERISDRYSSPHGSFWVLTGIGRANRWPELSSDRVAVTLAACREWVDFTVVDTGFSLEQDEEISSDLFAPQRNAATITALREADRVIAVGAGDPVGLSRFLRSHVELLELVDAERILDVINRIRSSVIGANPTAQVEQTLLRFGGIAASALVPHDQTALDAAILSGKTLLDVAAKSGTRVALRELVYTHLIPQQPNSPTKRTQRSRFEPQPQPQL